MAKKKKQTVGYKYFASGHLVLCHGPIDAITKISFQEKDAYLAEEKTNKTIYINKPSLFGGDEQQGGIQGSIELLFGRANQQKSGTLQRICARISNSFGGLISAYRGVCSVVFDNVYIGTSPSMPDSKWRVKRIHTRHDGQIQWYDEKAEISTYQIVSSDWEYVQAPYHANPGYENLTPPISGWSKNSYLPFNDSNGWAMNPELSVFWVRKKITIRGGEGVKLQVGADNGCLLWVDGNFIGASNQDNLDIASNQKYPVEFSVPRTGTFDILIKAFTESTVEKQAGNYLNIAIDGIKTGDINPAHIIRECLTNSIWGIGVAESSIDDDSFEIAADVLFNEGMGISIKWTDSTSINEFVDNIKEHVNAQLYLDRATNKWKLYLIRDDYDVGSLISLDESNIRNLDFERRTLAECVNMVTVTYYDRERAKDSTVTVQDIARIAQQGGVISQSIDYKGFTNSDLASRIALRELKTLSSTLASVSFDVDESFSELWHEGMAFRVSDESYGLSGAVMRVRTIKRGDGINNTVHVEAIEDSFSSPMQTVVEYVPPVTSGDSIAKDAKAIAFEVPYIELVEQYGQDEVDVKLLSYPELGFSGMAAVRPNNQHINASLYVDAGAGYDERTTLDFCPSATLKTEIGYIDSSFELQNVAEFELLAVNQRLQINDEIMTFISFDTASSILTVKRGCFDTVPQEHAAGSVIFGWDNYSGIDDVEYLSGEVLLLKALTLTGSDELDISEATEHILEVVGRAIRPYPPANVKINNEYFPADVGLSGSIVFTWVDRNRLQQTGGSALGFYEDGVTVESGVEYFLDVYEVDAGNNETLFLNVNVGAANTYTIDLTTALSTTVKYRIVLYSMRDGHESYSSFNHSILTSFGAPYNITGVYVP